jgi:hypothetical protein
MRIPDFTAEASLYERRRLYQGAANPATSIHAGLVTPAQLPAPQMQDFTSRLLAADCVCPCRILHCTPAGCTVYSC